MRRICILGVASNDLEKEQLKEQLTELDGGDTEIWAVNEAYRGLPEGRKADRVFQLHVRNWREADRSFLYSNGRRLPSSMNRNCFGRNKAHVDYLRTCGVPVYTQKQWEDIPTATVYPFERVREAVGIPLPPEWRKRLWATSSFGYMAALLITEHLDGQKIDEVLVLSCNLPLGTMRERIWEWPNLAYYLGLMKGMGIRIILPVSGNALLSAPHYALDGRPKPLDADHWMMPGVPGVIDDKTDGTWHLGTREHYPYFGTWL